MVGVVNRGVECFSVAGSKCLRLPYKRGNCRFAVFEYEHSNRTLNRFELGRASGDEWRLGGLHGDSAGGQ